MGSLVISIFLYACESGNFTAELDQRKAGLLRSDATERLQNILYKDYATNIAVHRKIQATTEEYA